MALFCAPVLENHHFRLALTHFQRGLCAAFTHLFRLFISRSALLR
jgi:hypothetical protein